MMAVPGQTGLLSVLALALSVDGDGPPARAAEP